MKGLYILCILILAGIFSVQQAHAQKRLRLQVTNVNTNKSTDCDGALNDSDFEWRWFNGGTNVGCDYYGGNNGAINTNNPSLESGAGSNNLRDNYYYSADCWPTGSYALQLRVGENDETFGSCNNGSYCSRNDNTTFPASTVGSGYTSTVANNTGVTCNNGCDVPCCGASNLVYRHTVRWYVTGSFPGSNLTGGSVNNQTCATAKSFNTSSSYTNQNKACRNIWYRYTTPSTPRKASVTVSSSAGGNVYARTSCGGSNIASGSGSVTVTCLSPSTTYYFYVAAGGTTTNVTFSSSNLAGNNVSGTSVTNSSCGAHIDLTTNGTGNLATNQENRCVTYTWYRYRLTANDSYLNFTVSGASNVRAYYNATESCTGCQVASGTSSISIADPQPGWYNVRVTANSNNRTVNVARGGTASNNYIWNATSIGTMPSGGGTLTSGVTNNNGSNAESGEPNQNTADSDDDTDWFTFTTGSTVPSNVDISVTEQSGNDIDCDFHVYRKNDAAYTFPRCGVNWGKLTSLGDGDGGNNVCLVGSNDSYLNDICVLPNTTYYIQVRGYLNNEFPCNENEDEGNYRVNVSGSTTAKGPDNFCTDVHDFGTIGNGYNSGNVYYNNTCNSTQGGEPRTGDMSHTMWYKFRSPAAGLASVNIELEEAGEGANYMAIALYSAASCTFGGLSERAFDRWCFFGSNNQSISNTCLPGNTDFYIQVGTGYNFGACTNLIDGGRSTGRYRVRLTTDSYATGPDNVCSASSIATLNGTTASASINNQTNICAGTQAGEPGGGQKTVWYTFTTGSTVGYDFNITMDAETNGLNSDVYVYEACSGCSFGGMTEIDNFFDINPLPGEWDAGGTISGIIKPNKTYYIRADGTSGVGVDGGFDLDISFSGGGYNSLDNICNASNISSSVGLGYNSGLIAGNNINSSDEDYCSINEPQENDNRTVWYKFRTAATVGTKGYVYVENAGGDNMTPDIAVFKGPTTIACSPSYTFSSLTYEGDDDGTYLVDNDAEVELDFCDGSWAPLTWYYVQIDDEGGGAVGYNEGNFRIRVRDNGYQEGQDNICSATNLGTINGVTGSDGINNQSNFCAGTQGGEPSGGQQTVWYTFTTGATVGYDFNINMDAETDGLNSDIYVYEACSGCSFAGLNEIDNFFDINPLPGEWDAGGTISGQIKPNTTYYIRADGTAGVGVEGGFDIDYNFSGGGYNGNDNFCAATNMGTLGVNSTLNANNFNNYTASAEETCVLDEPNVDENDETVWFRFTTGATPVSEIEIDVTAQGGTGQGGACVLGEIVAGWVKVYVADGSPALPGSCAGWTSSTNWFNGIVEPGGVSTGIDVSDLIIECPSPSTTFWVQVETGGLSTCDGATFDLVITSEGPSAPHDEICDAIELGLPTYANPQGLVGTYSPHALVNQNNFCAGNTNDPVACWSNPENDKTVWYKLPAAVAPGATDISNPGRQVVIFNALSNHAGGAEDEINLQLALYEVSSLSCPASTASFTLTSDQNGPNCSYVPPLSLDIDQLFQYSEYMTAACLDPTKDYYVQVDGNDLDLVFDEVLREGWFEFEAYYPREIGDDPCSAVPFKLFGDPSVNKTGLFDTLYNNSNLCTTLGNGALPDDPCVTFTTGCGSDNPGWIYFYAPASGVVRITAQSDPQDINKEGIFDGIDLQFAIFEENVIGNCNTLLQINNTGQDEAISYNIPDGYGEDFVVHCLEEGRKYYIMVDASTTPFGRTRGIFDIQIQDWAQDVFAPNDEMCNAIPLDTSVAAMGYPGYFWSHANNKLESKLLNESNWCANNLNEPGRPADGGFNETGVWYTFVAPPSGRVDITAENTNYTTVIPPNLSGEPNHIDLSIAVYQLNTGAGFTCVDYANPAATTLIAQDYDNALVGAGIAVAATPLEDEDLTVECLNPGETYYILISGKKSGGIGRGWDYGRFNLYVTSDPRNPSNWDGADTYGTKNDLVCGAVDLGTINTNTTWYQPVSTRKVPNNYTSDFVQSPPFNNFCATNTGDVAPAYTIPGTLGTSWTNTNSPDGNNKPVWFKFTTPATGAFDPTLISVEVEVQSDDCSLCALGVCVPESDRYRDCISSAVSVWVPDDGTCSGNMFEMGSDYDLLFLYDESADVHCLDPLTEYYIMVDGARVNGEGNFNVRIRQIDPDVKPSHNFICSAKPLTSGASGAPASFFTGGAYTIANDTNICADTRINAVGAFGTEPIPSGWDVLSPPSDANDMTHTVWYYFHTPATGGPYAVHIDVNSQLFWPFGDLVNPKIAVWESQDGTCNYTHPSGTNMVEMGSEYDPLAFWAESIDVYCLEANKRYYVQVGGTQGLGQDQGYFDIVIDNITPISIPTNNDICSAFGVGTTATADVTLSSTVGGQIGNASDGSNNYHNYCTDTETSEPVPGAFTPDNTIWFKFNTPNTVGKRYDVTINANTDPAPDHNDNINLQLALYESTDGSCNMTSLNEIESDFDGLLWGESLSAECLKPSTTYYVQVDGSSGLLFLLRALGMGYLGLEVVTDDVYDAPSNDNACNATALGSVPVGGIIDNGIWYYNNCATIEAGEPDPVGDIIDYDIERTVWFTFVPSRDADFRVEVINEGILGDNVDLQLAIFRSTATSGSCPVLDSMVQEAADYDPGFFGEQLTVPCLESGVTYYVQVDAAGGAIAEGLGLHEGNFQIEVEDVGVSGGGPANDDFCNATLLTLSGGTVSTSGNNVCASIEVSEPNTPADVQKSVWYRFQAPPSGRVLITLHDGDGALRGLDPEMYLHEVGATWSCASFAGLTELANAYNPLLDIPIIAPNLGDEEIEYECFIPGWWYVLQIDGTTIGGPQGDFDLTIDDLLFPYTVGSGNQPANNEIANAITLTIQDEQCLESSGSEQLQGSGIWSTRNYGKPTRSLLDGLGSGSCSIADLCGDTWYTFVVPALDCDPTYGGTMPIYSPLTIQGRSLTSDRSELHVIAYTGTPGSLTPIGCGEAARPTVIIGPDQYFDFEISEPIGTTIYLQVFGENADDWDKDYQICVSKRRGFDECIHAAQAPPLQYGVEYCYNIKGATSEPITEGYPEGCPLTGIPGVPPPDNGSVITENSVFFKFRTDNSCSDYQMTFKYHFSAYSAFEDKGISYSIYKDDGTPCDNTPIGSGVLDCQSLYNSSISLHTYQILFENNLHLTVASGIDTSADYYIQIDGPGQTLGNEDGTIMIEQVPVCLDFVANTHRDTTVSYVENCETGWRHYKNSSDEYIFSIFDNGNDFEGTGYIEYLPITHYEETRLPPSAKVEGEFVMRRLWDFQITSGVTDFSLNPVSIRFYYRDVEKQTIINEATAFAATYGLIYEPFEWFKSENGLDFDLVQHTTPTRVRAGFSETGCLSLFDTNTGDYIGPPGIQVCDVFVAQDDLLSCNGVTYVEISGITGFSGGTGVTGASRSGGSPLPVELVSFVGWNDGEVNELEWITSTEINNEVFVVERSADAINFTEIGSVPGNGNTTVEHTYNFTDVTPIIGTNYYRLKQIDFDGTYEYTSIIAIDLNSDVLKTAIVKIHPNPTNKLLNIQLQSANDTEFELRIIDVTGRTVESNQVDAVQGLNVPFALDVEKYPSGVYIISLTDKSSGERLEAKFVKE